MHKITEKENHLLVEFEDKITVLDIIRAIHEISGNSDISRMNDIWLFGNSPVFLQQDDLVTIVREIEKVSPPDMQNVKTALVASSGFNNFLAEAFDGVAKNLPFQIEVFRALPDAERWLAAS